MNQRQIKSLISLTNRLQKQKYPLIVIVVIVVASLLATGDWGQFRFSTASPTGDECEVVKVYDGDTMTIQCSGQSEKTRVRMYCIDTPEMKQVPWGTEARNHLRSITGKTVKLVEVDKDRYGRIVGEVYSGEINLNMAQVKAGKAAVYDAYCKKPEYKSAENEAKQNQLGIWSQTGLHQTPWEWRKLEREK